MRAFFCLATAVVAASCSPVSRVVLHKTFRAVESEFQDHVGFVLYDPERNEEVYAYNADKYFTPASNIKILTLYTALNILGDSVPALLYATVGDSLIFSGTGDPSFLYDEVFQNGRVFDFLQSSSRDLYFVPDNFHTVHYGPGWAWDDYNYAFSAERSSFPVYGNTFTIFKRKGSKLLETAHPFFKRFVSLSDSASLPSMTRDLASMRVDYSPSTYADSISWRIPFRTDPLFVSTVLADTLGHTVRLASQFPVSDKKILYSIPTDSLYSVMMKQSDNFISEQLLLLCAQTLADSLNPDIAIRYAMNYLFADLKDRPKWVDGSGLSRYNLVTPRSIVQVWQKLYRQVPRERLFSLLAIGGEPGTLSQWFLADEPFVFGKTGTLSNNHSLSGYLVTKRGKVLLFSFMNSNYVSPLYDVKKQMEEILTLIHQSYRK